MTEYLTCHRCGTTAPRPGVGRYAPLYDAGWRWRGDPAERPRRFAPRAFLFTCPTCARPDDETRTDD